MSKVRITIIHQPTSDQDYYDESTNTWIRPDATVFARYICTDRATAFKALRIYHGYTWQDNGSNHFYVGLHSRSNKLIRYFCEVIITPVEESE